MGKAFAKRLAESGSNVFMIALEADELEKLAKSWSEQYQVKIHWRALDLTSDRAVPQIAMDIAEKKMDVSFLLNAAGFGYFGEFLLMNPDQIQKMIKLNVIALIELCHLVLPKLKSRGGGTIINIASIAGHLPYPYAAVYASSKTMVHYFTKALWSENRDRNIRIISLSPGHTKTNFDNVSKEPDSIHLFPDEDPDVIAKTTLARVGSRCTLFTHPTHILKVVSARLLPIRLFAWMLRGLANKPSRS